MEYKVSKKGPLLAIVALAAIVLLPFGCMAGGAYTEAIPRLFNSTAWKAAEGDIRCGMIADLKFRVGVVGKTRQQLVQLLGPEESENPDTSTGIWHLCPSFADVWILEVRWKADRAQAAWVRDT